MRRAKPALGQIADATRVTRPDFKLLLDPGMEAITKSFSMAAMVNKVRDMLDRGGRTA